MRAFFTDNPMVLWLRWYVRTSKLLKINKKKNLKIGYLAKLVNVSFGSYNTFYEEVEILNAQLGDFVYVARNARISNVTIGSFCSVGPNVKIGLGIHPTDLISTFPSFYSARGQAQISFGAVSHFEESKTVTVGSDVWIGYGAVILDGVSIGHGAIIGAGAVVTKDVAPYTIMGGVPAKEIKKRFSSEITRELLDLKWWDKGLDWVQNHAADFNDPEVFLKKMNDGEF